MRRFPCRDRRGRLGKRRVRARGGLSRTNAGHDNREEDFWSFLWSSTGNNCGSNVAIEPGFAQPSRHHGLWDAFSKARWPRSEAGLVRLSRHEVFFSCFFRQTFQRSRWERRWTPSSFFKRVICNFQPRSI
jgi:hypothetical protein